jgi:hypothetical protein
MSGSDRHHADFLNNGEHLELANVNTEVKKYKYVTCIS